ncbi:MAG: HAMP domain-containing histidine kinase [Chloroflexi bacterium]|nr:HAMP domain-containing histidine kinase [Chloroflexota bacterium]MCL5075602.1 HAMP domain-containing histidine kinase [Chloroflexota bacterium]
MRTSIHTKLVSGFLVMVLPLLGLGLVAYIETQRLYKVASYVTEEYVTEIHPVMTLQVLLGRLALLSHDYVLDREPAVKEEFRRTAAQAEMHYSDLEKVEMGYAEERMLVAGSRESFVELTRRFDDLTALSDPIRDSRSLALLKEIGALADTAIADLARFHEIAGKEINEAIEQAQATKTLAEGVIILSVLLSILAATALGHLLAGRIARPIRQLKLGAEAFRSGNFDYRLQVRTGDEIGDLAEAFKAMAVELKNSHQDLEQKVAEKTRELTETRERLRALGQLKSSFIDNVSHELRTPLTILRGYIELLQARLHRLNKEEIQAYVAVMAVGEARLRRQVESLLDFTLLDEGVKLALDLQPHDLATLVKEVVGDYSDQIETKKMALTLDIPPQLSLLADGRRLSTAIGYLLDNAIKFTSPAGQIVIRARQVETSVEISVSDNGIGIPPDQLETIFQGFHKIEGQGVGRGGMGLGLALAKRIVEAHSGQIRAESRLGQGSTFTISLPIAPA